MKYRITVTEGDKTVHSFPKLKAPRNTKILPIKNHHKDNEEYLGFGENTQLFFNAKLSFYSCKSIIRFSKQKYDVMCMCSNLVTQRCV